MSEGPGDVFERLAAQLLERPHERQRFLEAARVLLALDPTIKRLPAGQRAKLISKPAGEDEIVANLLSAIQRVLDDAQKAKDGKIAPDAALQRRIYAAYVVALGLPATFDRLFLNEAVHILRDIWDEAEKAALQDRGRKRHEQNPTKETPEDRELVGKVQHEAAKLQSKYPNRSKSFRLHQLMPRFPGRWTTANALRMWAKRRNIEI